MKPLPSIAAYVRTVGRFNRDVRLYFLTTALLGFTVFGGIYPVLFNLYLLRLGYGPEFVGAVNSVAMFTFALCSLAAGSVGQRWGVRRAMVWGLSVALMGYSVLPLVESLPPAWKGGWLIATSMANGLSWSITTFAGGYVIAGLGYRALFLAGAALSVVGSLFFWARFCVAASDPI